MEASRVVALIGKISISNKGNKSAIERIWSNKLTKLE